MAGPNYHFAVLNDLKKKTASSESRVLNFKYPAKHGQGRAVSPKQVGLHLTPNMPGLTILTLRTFSHTTVLLLVVFIIQCQQSDSSFF